MSNNLRSGSGYFDRINRGSLLQNLVISSSAARSNDSHQVNNLIQHPLLEKLLRLRSSTITENKGSDANVNIISITGAPFSGKSRVISSIASSLFDEPNLPISVQSDIIIVIDLDGRFDLTFESHLKYLVQSVPSISANGAVLLLSPRSTSSFVSILNFLANGSFVSAIISGLTFQLERSLKIVDSNKTIDILKSVANDGTLVTCYAVGASLTFPQRWTAQLFDGSIKAILIDGLSSPYWSLSGSMTIDAEALTWTSWSSWSSHVVVLLRSICKIYGGILSVVVTTELSRPDSHRLQENYANEGDCWPTIFGVDLYVSFERSKENLTLRTSRIEEEVYDAKKIAMFIGISNRTEIGFLYLTHSLIFDFS
ncbi:uncharacterized protein V1516DRAFT_678145 [Lipomyces oligophaga]|uniref:uncharacterized protein n=1 Tax=Lipomyces oligophaga TaxID=45792 RepID=UPI0034CF1981